ncbi:MAG TPA: PDZ domain-containing protein [Planctomycetota bacterium]|nr:PDZ domain-containing protein [Planctomycetota bacterium]
MLRRFAAWAVGLGMALVGSTSRAAERPLSEAIRAAADAVRPAVVGIEVKGRDGAAPRAMPDWPFGRPGRPGEPRQWRFEWQWPPREGPPREGQPPILPFGGENLPQIQRLFRQQPAEGTGLILEVEGDRGLVAAPHALVAGAEAVFVRLPDGRQLAAKPLGDDAVSGIACLEVRDAKLAVAKLAAPDAAQVGDWVLAVGGPETAGAVTIGIISTKKHPGEGEMAGVQVLEADITLAEGMAGGPLVNLSGEVVGITLPPAGRAGQGRGLATVVPVDTVQATMHALAKEGKVRRGWLGIVLQPLDPEALRGLKIDAGIQVARVLQGQPAAKAGVEAGDVILALDGRNAADVDTFRGLVSAKAPGTRVSLKVLRAAKEMIFEVTLGELGAGGVVPPEAPALPQGGEKLELGLSLQPLTPELAAQFGFEGDKGLLVTDVAAGSPASKARPTAIARGELLKEIGRKPVATMAEAKAAIAEARKANEKTVLMLVRGKDGARYVVVDLGQER